MREGIRLGSVRPDVADVLKRIGDNERRIAAVQGGSAITAIPPEAAGGALMLMPLGTPNASGYNSTTSTSFVELQRLYFTKSASTARYLHYHITATVSGQPGYWRVGCGFVNLTFSEPVFAGETASKWICLDMANLPPYQAGTAVYVGGYALSGGTLSARIDGAFMSAERTVDGVDTYRTLADTTAPVWNSPGLSAVKNGDNTITVSWTNNATDNIGVTRYRVTALGRSAGIYFGPQVAVEAAGSPITVPSEVFDDPQVTFASLDVQALDAMGNRVTHLVTVYR